MGRFENRKESIAKATIFNIQPFSIQDGPGIRTTVFFKGCPLRCPWCSNPESQAPYPELLFYDSLCTKCYRCVAACPTKATMIDTDGSVKINRELCQACGKCVEVCISGARAISGKVMTVEEVLDVVKKDRLFYLNSGGGVTASGGEPLSQPDFLIEFFKRCQEVGLHTTLDTCGYASWKVMERVLEYVDLVLYDIKHMDSEKHEELIKVDNRLILENAKMLAQKGKPTIIRVPLIPGYNDSEENIEALGKFLVETGLTKVDLYPYHQLGLAKYRNLGREYELGGVSSCTEEQVQVIEESLRSHGLEVAVI